MLTRNVSVITRLERPGLVCLRPFWNTGFLPAQFKGTFRERPPASVQCGDPRFFGKGTTSSAHTAPSKGMGAPRASVLNWVLCPDCFLR